MLLPQISAYNVIPTTTTTNFTTAANSSTSADTYAAADATFSSMAAENEVHNFK
jgi:hypothetical protein